MTREEWLLFLHLFAGFALVAGVMVFGALAFVAKRPEGAAALRLTTLGRRLWDVGGLGTLLLGIWLALDIDGYSLTDGWIIAAIVLWIVAAGAGSRLGQDFSERQAGGEGTTAAANRTPLLLAITSVAVLALVVVMVYKPGA